ncbi:hypothetical protein [Sphingomonas sp. LM7]|uniref:hypothetical protein n=1 Tax=Sphingomonas sp. LM7 TaxID=1938607 RepID=UPI0009840896|nr:hypothetical protein [Sphingomonas sp. LM7]AQR73426.1 hypothetical protein BXU08_07030 [Sphingomonas sp. LM7]
MTSTPPIPAENKSPYPIEEASHDHAQDNETVAIVREMAAAKQRRASGPNARQLGIGAAVGIGSAAIVAGLLYWRGNRKDGK